MERPHWMNSCLLRWKYYSISSLRILFLISVLRFMIPPPSQLSISGPDYFRLYKRETQFSSNLSLQDCTHSKVSIEKGKKIAEIHHIDSRHPLSDAQTLGQLINKISKQFQMYNPLSVGKKAIRRRQEQRHMQGYLQRIKNVRPNTTGRQQEIRFLNNGKKQMLLEDKFTEIQRENRLLLEKITTTMNKRTADGERDRMNKSLNSNFRKKQLQNIEIENARLLKRLQDKKSDYDTGKLKEEWKKQKAVIKNIANYPLIIRDGSRRERKRVFSREMDSANLLDRSPLQKDVEMMRIRNFNGTNIIVTVRLGQDKLTILGDLKRGKDVKIIEVPREEAMEFIEQECDGRFEGIFDRLHFEPAEEVLYLMAKDAELGNPQDLGEPQEA